jgi:hypothetical protein
MRRTDRAPIGVEALGYGGKGRGFRSGHDERAEGRGQTSELAHDSSSSGGVGAADSPPVILCLHTLRDL